MICSEDVEKARRDAERALLASVAQRVWEGDLPLDEVERKDLCQNIAELVSLRWRLYDGWFPCLSEGGLSKLEPGGEVDATFALSAAVVSSAPLVLRGAGLDVAREDVVVDALSDVLAKMPAHKGIRVVRIHLVGKHDFGVMLPPTPPLTETQKRIQRGIAGI